jgi:hypothetical protein
MVEFGLDPSDTLKSEHTAGIGNLAKKCCEADFMTVQQEGTILTVMVRYSDYRIHAREQS